MAQATRRVKLIAAVLSPLLVIGLLEAGLRVAGFRYVPGRSAVATNPEESEPHHYVPDRDLLWKLRPSTVIDDWRNGFVGVSTNSLGLRGEELPSKRRDGELRVLCLGDSITFGLGVPDELTWPAFLRNALESDPRLRGRPLLVVNGGVSGWSSVQGMRLLKKLDWLEPDVIVFWYGMNDVQDARGIPDSRQHGMGGAAGGIASTLGRLRTVQLLSRLRDAVRGPPGLQLRATLAEYGQAVEALGGRGQGDGPKVVFIRCPNLLRRTESQLDLVFSRATEEGVGFVSGPSELFSRLSPVFGRDDFTPTAVDGPRGRELRFGEEAAERHELRRIRGNLDMVRRWRQELEKRLDLLPEDAVGAAEMFGDLPADRVFTDNVHLTEEGNERAAKAIAARILNLLK